MVCFMELTSVAFIPDGNRRYALKAGISLLDAYQLGTKKAWEVFEWLQEYPKIKTGTFWSLSLENFKRASEIPLLFKIFEKELDKVVKSGLFAKHSVKLNFLGRREVFPKKLRLKMEKAERFTENFSEKTMNVALGYSGQAEIVDACKKIAQKINAGEISLNEINEQSFAGFLYSPACAPDLIVRTSGVQRTSGFLPFQSVYSELYFTPKLWPEFSKQDLDLAIRDYYARERRFGK